MDKNHPLFSRYSDAEKEIVLHYFALLAKTRKTGRIALPVIMKQLKHWESYPVAVVMEALRVHINRYPNKKEAYTLGIMRGMRREEELMRKQSAGGRYGQGRYKGHYWSGGNDGKMPF